MPERKLTPREKNFLMRHHFNFDTQKIPFDIPVEYLVNSAEFRGLDFYVDSTTLIPRIETEKIVDLALKNITENYTKEKKIILADLCTGSGCIGISLTQELLKNNYDFHIFFSDISELALKIAKKNFEHLLPKNQNMATFLVSNIFENFPQNVKLDLVVSNPPYVPTERIKSLDISVKDYEPTLALDGGSDGLLLINKIISVLPKVQKNKVNCLLEIDSTHRLSQIKSEGLNPSLIKDCFGRNRFLSLLSL